jgi:hypothetical protein
VNLLIGEEFGRLFRSFEHTAFRLETREEYRAPVEEEPLRQFIAGQQPDMARFTNWLTLIRAATAQGRRFRRVRVVSRPLTDYNRFGHFCASYPNEAGDDIRYLDRVDANGLPDHDYWLFDSRTLVRMHFGEDSTFLGGEAIDDPAAVVRHNYWRDAAWHLATPRDEFEIG